MKRIILIALCLVSIAYAQTPPTNYTQINARYQWLAGMFKALTAPAGITPALTTGQWGIAGAIYVDTSGTDKGLYVYYDGVWNKAGGDAYSFTNGITLDGDSVKLGGLMHDASTVIENGPGNLTSSLSISTGVGGTYKSIWSNAYNGNNILTSDAASTYLSGMVNTGPTATFFGATQRPWQSYLYTYLNGSKYSYMGIDSNWAKVKADSLRIDGRTTIIGQLKIGKPTGGSTFSSSDEYVFQATRANETTPSRLNVFAIYIGPDSVNAPTNVVDVGIGTKNVGAGLGIFVEDGTYQQTWRPNGGTVIGKGWATNAGHHTPPVNGLAVQGKTELNDTLWYNHHGASASSSDSVMVRGSDNILRTSVPLSSLGGGGGETLQDVLTNGSTLTTANTIDLGITSLNFNTTAATSAIRLTNGGVTLGDPDAVSNGTVLDVNHSGSSISMTATDGATSTGLSMNEDSVNITGVDYSIDTTARKVLTINPATGALAYNNWLGAGGGGGSTELSALTAASGSNTINNANNAQEWQWNSLAGATGLKISSNSTAAASNAQSLFNVELSGANGTSAQTTSAVTIANTHTGTTSKNIGATISASGGTNNFGARISPALLIGSPTENATDGLIIQSPTNTATDGMRIYANNNSSFTQYGWATITRAGAFTVATTSGAINMTPSTGVYIGSTSTATALLQLAAGTTSKPPMRFTSGSLATGGNILAGNVEFLTDKWYGTISTGPAAKEFTMNDAALTSGTVPVATTNGRLTDGLIIASGTYTPTPTGISNVSAISRSGSYGYTRVGNQVTVTGTFDLTPTAGTTLTTFYIALPVASAFTSIYEGRGAFWNRTGEPMGLITMDATNDRAQGEITPSTTGLTTYNFSFTYTII